MKKKVVSLMIISMFLVTGFITSVQSIETKKQKITTSQPQLPTSSESCPLESITIDTMTTLIKNRLHQMPYTSRFKARFTRYIEMGIKEMEKLGVTPEKNLFETQTILTDELLPLKPSKAHFFLMNLYPDSVDITTTIPTYVENLTGDDWADNTTLEIFVKLIPFFDSVETVQRIILRKLYQETSLLLPAIGARIREDNSTVFIVAFGPGIKWSWRFF